MHQEGPSIQLSSALNPFVSGGLLSKPVTFGVQGLLVERSAAVNDIIRLSPYSPPYVDRIWGIWGSYYSIPKVIFYLLEAHYNPKLGLPGGYRLVDCEGREYTSASFQPQNSASKPYMSCSLNFLKVGYLGDYIGFRV